MENLKFKIKSPEHSEKFEDIRIIRMYNNAYTIQNSNGDSVILEKPATEEPDLVTKKELDSVKERVNSISWLLIFTISLYIFTKVFF